MNKVSILAIFEKKKQWWQYNEYLSVLLAVGSLEMAYVCKIASLEEMERKWNAEILRNIDEKDNWVAWKAEAMENEINHCSITCYGILDDQIICEATAIILPGKPQNDEGLVDDQTAYLCAFRTMEEYRGQGFFSKLLNFLFENLRSRGFKRATVGVEVGDETNLQIYRHFGFVHYIKQGRETYPDGTAIDVRYYAKTLGKRKNE